MITLDSIEDIIGKIWTAVGLLEERMEAMEKQKVYYVILSEPRQEAFGELPSYLSENSNIWTPRADGARRFSSKKEAKEVLSKLTRPMFDPNEKHQLFRKPEVIRCQGTILGDPKFMNTRFQELLRPNLTSTPKQEQERASRQLPDVVGSSHLRWWTREADLPTQGKALLLVVAPYSHYDLALLDMLDGVLASGPILEIYVANLLQYQTFAQLTEDIPGITQAPPQTPVVVVWENGKWTEPAYGKQGRNLVALAIGVSSEDLSERVIARVPIIQS